MPMQTIPAKDGGHFQAYVAMPPALPAPTIVLIQEIFGVNAEMRAKCDEFAHAGYIAVCPDLFWRLEPGVQLSDKSKAEWDKAFDLFNRFDVDQGVEDLHATVHVYQGHAQGNGAVGVIGYCLGGKLAYLMAARARIACAVSYYGVGLDALLEESRNIKTPLLMHIAQLDKFVPPAAQEKIRQGLQDNDKITMHTYEGVDHAFARGGGEHYNEAAATLANQRTADFFARNLKQAAA